MLQSIFDGALVFSIGVFCGGVSAILFRDIIVEWFKGGRG